MIRTLFIFGTRPEAIKLCPVIRHMRSRPDEFELRVCVTAQHREMLDQVLNVFEVYPDRDLDIMSPGQTLYQSTSRIIAALETVLAEEKPDFVLVQGDTTTTLCGALTAFYARIPIGHVEAGLRTGDLENPFPEELNRVLTTKMSNLHFAPTQSAANNLLSEEVPIERVMVTGNTGIDALLYTRGKLEEGNWRELELNQVAPDKRLILITAHRRESFGGGLERICDAVKRIASRGDVEIFFPVHPNPNVRTVVEKKLKNIAAVHLVDPLDYVPFVDLMRRACIILTDSGGIQEEAPSLGVPVLVLRSKTERQEAVEAGTAELVGTDPDLIVLHVNRLLSSTLQKAGKRVLPNPFGDGQASVRIANALLHYIGQSPPVIREQEDQWAASCRE